jgi:hypothetical protein
MRREERQLCRLHQRKHTGLCQPISQSSDTCPGEQQIPAIKGAWLDVTYTYPISYDSRVVEIDMLPAKETDHLIDLFEYFQAEKLCHCNSRLVSLESQEQERAWYEKQRETAYQHEQDRKQREKLKRVSNIILPFYPFFLFYISCCAMKYNKMIANLVVRGWHRFIVRISRSSIGLW